MKWNNRKTFPATRLIGLVAILLALLWAGVAGVHPALAQDGGGDEVVMGGTYVLQDGEELDGNLTVMGGVATIEEGATVNGDVTVMGGTLRVRGEVSGNITAIGGMVSLSDTAEVGGDVDVSGANLSRDDGAQIGGSIRERHGGPFNWVVPGGVGPRVEVRPNPLWEGFISFLSTLFISFVTMGLAVLAVLFLPRQTQKVSDTARNYPIISGGIGLLTAIVAPILLAVIAITILLIPVTLLGAAGLLIAWTMGTIAIGTDLGIRLMHSLRQDWALPISAAIGTFLLVFLTNLISMVVPCIGWLAPVIPGLVGLGAVVLSRFGTYDYPPQGPAAPAGMLGPVPPPSPAYPPQPAPTTDPLASNPASVYPLSDDLIIEQGETEERPATSDPEATLYTPPPSGQAPFGEAPFGETPPDEPPSGTSPDDQPRPSGLA